MRFPRGVSSLPYRALALPRGLLAACAACAVVGRFRAACRAVSRYDVPRGVSGACARSGSMLCGRGMLCRGAAICAALRHIVSRGF